MVDYKSLVEQADLYYCGVTPKAYQGMPIGNGVTGSMVWLNQSAIQMQINRVDVFATNSAATSADWNMDAPDYVGGLEYCSGCAKAAIDFGEPVFSDMTTQTLHMYDAVLNIHAEEIHAEAAVWAEKDVFVWNVQDFRREKRPVRIVLSMLRPALVTYKAHRSESAVEENNEHILLTQQFSETCTTGIAENDHFCASCVAASVKGGKILAIKREADESIVMEIMPESEHYQIFFSSGASFQSLEEAKEHAEAALKKALETSCEMVLKSHVDWWHAFWKKSFLYTPEHPEFSIAWYTYLYYIGSTMRGAYPAKFNGLLFSTDGDVRFWGAQYWWFNQSRSHYGLAQANHGECNHPLFGMLLRNLPRYEKACEQQFGGNGGIYLPETDAFSGPEILPEEIAADLKAVLLEDAPATERLLKFMEDRSGLNSRWADFYSWLDQKEGDVQKFRWHSNLSYDAGDAGNSMLEYYYYTQDEEWLQKIYPWLKGVAEFYRHHPCGQMEEDGRYHIDHLGWAESITHAKDIIDDITVMKGIYPTVIAIAEKFDVDGELREEWKKMLEILPEYPTSEMEDAIAWKQSADGLPVYAIGRKPCKMMAEGNPNDCRLRMTFSYDLLNLETKKNNPKEWEMANRTLDALPVIRLLKQGIPALNGETFGYAFNRVLVKAAMLGRTDLIRSGLPAVLRAFRVATPCPTGERDFPNRLPLTNGAGGYSIQEIGTFSDQIQAALLQSVVNGPGRFEHVIYVVPAWPMEWDVSFELRAKGAFLVAAEVKGKQLSFVRIQSEKGKRCLVHNPWYGEKVALQREDSKIEWLEGEILAFDTVEGGEYILSRAEERIETSVGAPCKICLDMLAVDKELEEEIPAVEVGKKTILRMSDEKNAAYTSSDETVLSVERSTVTGKQPGSVVVQAWRDGNIVAERRVNVCWPIVNDDSERITYERNWEQKQLQFDGSYRNDYHLSKEAGATATVTFEGCGIEIYGPCAPGFGEMRVRVDNESCVVSCEANEWLSAHILYRKKLEQGEHRLKLESCGEKAIGLDYIRVITRKEN